eukprot:5792237-Amphidinium_carterae.1
MQAGQLSMHNRQAPTAKEASPNGTLRVSSCRQRNQQPLPAGLKPSGEKLSSRRKSISSCQGTNIAPINLGNHLHKDAVASS